MSDDYADGGVHTLTQGSSELQTILGAAARRSQVRCGQARAAALLCCIMCGDAQGGQGRRLGNAGLEPPADVLHVPACCTHMTTPTCSCSNLPCAAAARPGGLLGLVVRPLQNDAAGAAAAGPGAARPAGSRQGALWSCCGPAVMHAVPDVPALLLRRTSLLPGIRCTSLVLAGLFA